MSNRRRYLKSHFFSTLRRIFSLQYVIVLATSIMILLPIYNILVNSFTSVNFGVPAGFTFQNYVTAFSDPEFGSVFLNSFIFSLGSAMLAILAGTVLAWILTRTDTPLRQVGQFLPIIPFLFPPVIKNIAWVYILAPRSGIINSFLSEIAGTQVRLFNAFSIPAMIWTYGLATIPLAYMFILPAFLSIDPSMEEAAHLSGAGNARTMFKIVLPLAFPAILSVFIILFVRGLEVFETPVVQGLPGGIYVLMSKIYDATRVRNNPGLGTAYASILVLVTMSFLTLYIWWTRRAEKYATIVGRGYNPRIIRLGRWRYATFLVVLGYFVVSTVFPLVVVGVISVIPYFEYFTFKNFVNFFTLNNYITVLNHPTFTRAIVNSLILGLLSSAVTVPISAVMSYVIHRGGGRGKKLFEFIGTLPMGFPGMILALGLLWSYYGTPLFGSIWGILVAFVIVYIPYSLRTLSAAFLRIHKELEEAATTHGASWLYTFTRITVPLLKAALGSVFFYIFIQSQRSLGEVALLSGPGLELVPTVIFDYYNLGQWAETAACSLIYATILLGYVLIAKYVLRIRFSL